MPTPGPGLLSQIVSCSTAVIVAPGVLGLTWTGIVTDAQTAEPAVAPAAAGRPPPVAPRESCEPAEQGGGAGKGPEQDRDPEHEVKR